MTGAWRMNEEKVQGQEHQSKALIIDSSYPSIVIFKK
jgi:hypothetical protein